MIHLNCSICIARNTQKNAISWKWQYVVHESTVPVFIGKIVSGTRPHNNWTPCLNETMFTGRNAPYVENFHGLSAPSRAAGRSIPLRDIAQRLSVLHHPVIKAWMNRKHALTLKRKLSFPSLRDESLRDHLHIHFSHIEISVNILPRRHWQLHVCLLTVIHRPVKSSIKTENESTAHLNTQKKVTASFDDSVNRRLSTFLSPRSLFPCFHGWKSM